MGSHRRVDITSNTYWEWVIENIFICYPAQTIVGKFIMTFKDFPPAQHAASFNLDQAMAKLSEATSGAHH